MGRRAAALATLLALAPWASAFADPGVEPKAVNVTLAPGGETTVDKVVHTPPIPPKPDIYFLADTTGSMTTVLDNVKANASSILAQVDGATPDPRYGAGDYKDFPKLSSPYAYKNAAPIPGSDDNGAAALAAIGAWTASGGLDGPEANLFALHRLVTDAGFRPDSTRIVVWFGDAPGHDPVCAAISGEAADVTEASVTAELQAAKVRVIAVSTTTGYPNGLDDDPRSGAADYNADCGDPGGSAGQASRIAAATGGKVFKDVPPEDVSNAIKEGLANLPVEVTPSASCSAGLTATFDPATKTVTSGTDASFVEKLSLGDAPTGSHPQCTVDFLLNGKPAGDAFVQKVTINRPPDCKTLAANPASLWPPNHKFVTVTVSGSDPDGDPVAVKITGVTQDEPLNGLGDGDTSPDAAWVSGHDEQVKLRAERSGTGDGRVYRITATLTSGKDSCKGTVNVTVPHDQSGAPAVDSGLVVNSFGP